MAKTVKFMRPDGGECSGYYAEPSGEAAPSVVVIQEWWGLNDQIKGVANRLAQAGYRALVPDLYRGKVTVEMAEADHLMKNLNFGDAATQDIRGAVKHLKAEGRKVAVLGYCMGGALAILSAVYVAEADAAVCWYGIPPAEAADVRKIKIPVQGHFALEDDFFPPTMADDLERRLREGSVNYEFFRYQAKHAFGNETIPNHNAEATRLAWGRTLDFLARHLK